MLRECSTRPPGPARADAPQAHPAGFVGASALLLLGRHAAEHRVHRVGEEVHERVHLLVLLRAPREPALAAHHPPQGAHAIVAALRGGGRLGRRRGSGSLGGLENGEHDAIVRWVADCTPNRLAAGDVSSLTSRPPAVPVLFAPTCRLERRTAA